MFATVAPVLLGSGGQVFDGIETFDFEPVEVLHSPLATHIRYQRRRRLTVLVSRPNKNCPRVMWSIRTRRSLFGRSVGGSACR
jgi:hypothetical protein